MTVCVHIEMCKDFLGRGEWTGEGTGEGKEGTNNTCTDVLCYTM